MPERTTVRLPEELLKRAKRKAVRDGRTLTALIEDGLRLVLTEPRPSRTVHRRMPRVSTAIGGLRSGQDIASPVVVQEDDDLAYVERLRQQR